jgi:dTDP-4-dehydrorhamnose 3,5-epimerase
LGEFKLKICKGALDGIFIIDAEPFTDDRGSFTRFFCPVELTDLFGSRSIKQLNSSVTKKPGSIRGMHFQLPPKMEMKLVRCIKGSVWDVVVDLRQGSQTFLKWESIEISAKNQKMVLIPEGFGHGFQVLDENSELLYLHSQSYEPKLTGRVKYDDPRLSIDWPLPVADISLQDLNVPFLTNAFNGIDV